MKTYTALFVYRTHGTKHFWRVGCTEDDTLRMLMEHYEAHRGSSWEFVSLTIEQD